MAGGNVTAPFRLMPVIDATVDDAEIVVFLADRADATAFHSPAWCNAVARATGHRFHRLAARNAAGHLVGYLPLHHVRSMLFGDALVSTGFAVEGGILADDPATAEALAAAAVALAGELGVKSIELRGGHLPNGWQHDSVTNVLFERPLATDRDAELAAIPRKHRAEVRKGLANDFAIRTGSDAGGRRDHYAVYAESVRNLGTPVFPRRLFDAVLDAFGDDADILTVADAEGPVSSVLTLYWRGSALPYWGGGRWSARSLRGNERMYFELMNHARARGMARFNFGRSKADSGPAAYKKNWGFEARPLSYARWTADGASARNTDARSGKYQLMVSTWQKLPLWLANRIGPFIARQLG